jgi:hypothetical protein
MIFGGTFNSKAGDYRQTTQGDRNNQSPRLSLGLNCIFGGAKIRLLSSDVRYKMTKTEVDFLLKYKTKYRDSVRILCCQKQISLLSLVSVGGPQSSIRIPIDVQRATAGVLFIARWPCKCSRYQTTGRI